jgi:hypothetical protein
LLLRRSATWSQEDRCGVEQRLPQLRFVGVGVLRDRCLDAAEGHRDPNLVVEVEVGAGEQCLGARAPIQVARADRGVGERRKVARDTSSSARSSWAANA